MAHNPKLNVYTLRLNPKDDSMETFRDLFKVRYNCNIAVDDKSVFEKYFQDFLNSMGKEDFKKDVKSKKVLGVSQLDENAYSINPHLDSCTIEGVIDGGKYGILREYADIDNKKDKKTIDGKNAVLDKFYFLLCTPLNSKYGFLLIQSYTEETIQETFKEIIKPLFCCENAFYNIVIEPFVPKRFVDKFEKEARIRLFSYVTKIGVSEIIRDDKVVIKGQAFEVKIELRPIEVIKPKSEILNDLLPEIGRKKFDDYELGKLKQTIYIEDNKERKAHFDIEKEISSIKPTIYLDDEGIVVDANTSLPDFAQMKVYCYNLLDDVKSEFNKKSSINEF